MDHKIHDYICFNFYTGWREIDQFYKNELGNDITPQITYILQICKLDVEMPIKDISKEMKLNVSAVSNLIARMEKNRLVIRRHDDVDRRVVRVKLTQKGYDLLLYLEGKIKSLEEKIAMGITPEEKATLLKIVSKISNSRANNQL